MADIERAIRFPFSESQWLQKLIVGGVLNIIPFVNFFSIGYAYQVYKSSLERKETSMPEWKNWDSLFIKGLIISIIVICYSFIPAFCTILGLHLVMKGWLASFLGGLLLILGFGGGLVSLFFLPMSVASYILEGEQIAGAFRFRDILDKIRDIQRDYLSSYLVSIGMVILAGLLLFLPAVKYIAFGTGLFYVYLFMCILFGETCVPALGKTAHSEDAVIRVVRETEERAEKPEEKINEKHTL